MKTMTSTLSASTLTLKRSGAFPNVIIAGIVAFALLNCPAVRAATLQSKAPNASVYFGLPFASLEFENPLSGGEMVLSHKVLDWRDADYAPGPPRWYDDWSVNDTNNIDGNLNEIWLRQTNHSAWTTTTVPSTIVSVHLNSDDNDGLAEVLVDGVQVAKFDMWRSNCCETVLVIVTGLSNTTHTIKVNDLGWGVGGTDVSILGAAALKESDFKWNQPPAPANLANDFYGWNQPSEVTLPGMLIAADDWVCTSTNPVTKIRWWGSYLGWTSNTPPAQTPSFFQITFYSDVPTNATQPFSQPGNVEWQINCANYTCQFVGWDYDPRGQTWESCFLFEQTLMPSEYFQQTNGVGTIHWISIAANFVLGPQPPPSWGWKTRPRDPASTAPDDAVMSPNNVPGWSPIFWPDPTKSWDLAFELISQYEDSNFKWYQPPDFRMSQGIPLGMDVNATYSPGTLQPGITNLLADDFRCDETGLITNITIWCSWWSDLFPSFPPTNVTFVLSFHQDFPVPNPYGYSMPGSNLWLRTFGPGSFTCTQVTSNAPEGWLDPPNIQYLPVGDAVCFRYDFAFPAGQAFQQQKGTVYWLDVQAQLPGTSNCRLGWKTSTTNWNDDACHAFALEPFNGPVGIPPKPWNRLTYPPFHPLESYTVDLAFALNYREANVNEVKWSQPPMPYTSPDGYNGWNQLSIEGQQIVADDWACTNAKPVTDIHWWGSFIGWSMPSLPEQLGPTLPDGFNITIWNDVPQGANDPFSHPTNIVWQTYCTNFSWGFAGWDFDPRNPAAPPEACFEYHQDLLPEKWFTQNPRQGTNIYWISIAAVYINGPPSIYPWGWKTRPHDPNSLAPDDAVYSDPGSPVGWQPIEYPAGTSWDMAFVLTTQTPLDFGDAPSPFPTLLANDGARHIVVPGVFLGKLIDAEPDGQPNANATGDDLNNLADEDGVVLYGTLLIPGDWATVDVATSTNGYLSAWVDFTADGSWATPGDQIFTNLSLLAGTNTLYFYVPQAAAQGSNVFARFRFSTAQITNFTGLAVDGEVEDYMWPVAEVDYGDAPDPPFPTLHASNGARHWRLPGFLLGNLWDWEIDGQPNATATGDDTANLPDEDGVTLLTPMLPGQPASVQVIATMPFGLVNAPLNAWIDFGADGSWATPGDQICTNAAMVPGPNLVTFNVPANAAAGSNVFARFRFSTMPNLTFTNALGPPGTTPNGEVEDYMWRISQLDFGDAPDPPYPTYLASNGARHAIVPGFCLGSLEDAEANGLPNALATGDDTNNLADEDGVVLIKPLVIGTQACVNVTLSGTSAGKLDAWIDFNTNGSWLDAGEQIMTSAALSPGTNIFCFNVPASAGPGPTFARFRLSSAGGLTPTGLASDGEVEDYRFMLGWQRPSTNIVITNIFLRSMFDGWNETSVLGGTNTVAADDWVCTSTNPITDIRWWGSFLNWQSTNPPSTLPSRFHIVFWTDVPTNFGQPFSHPGNMLAEIYCTNFTCQFVGWDLDPRTLAYEACFRFDQRLAPEEWFYQTNAPTGTNIYWLSIAAVYDLGVPDQAWGWKTRPRDTNSLAPDDAVRFTFPNGPYQPLYWPTSSNSWDLAFELVFSYTNVIDKWEQLPDLTATGIDVNDTSYGIPNPPPYLLADDFQCHMTGPLTDITIWGSWTNDWETPDAAVFTLSIHKDVPAQGGTNSMPGQLLWTQTFAPGQYQWQVLPVPITEGWLTPPANYAFPADHACWQFDFHIATNAFVQTNGVIYWLDVQVQLPPPGGMTPAPAFGWKTTLPQYRWNDDAVWVNATEPYAGNAWKDLHYPPGHAYYPQTLDLAFRVANSQPVYQPKWSQPPATNRCVTIEWNAEANVHYQVVATTNLVSPVIWTNVGPELIGPVHEQSDTDVSETARFYRVVAPNVVP